MANKEKSAVMLDKNSGMFWFDILTRILMPIQSILFLVISIFFMGFSLLTVNDVTEKILKKEDWWFEFGEKLEKAGLRNGGYNPKGPKANEIPELGILLFTAFLLFAALGIFVLVSRSSLLYYEKKSIKMFLWLNAANVGATLFIAFCLWTFKFNTPVYIIFIIDAVIALAWGIANYFYLRTKSYQFTI